MSRNRELADVFDEIASVLQYQGESWFKVRAYLAFAERLRGMDVAIEDLDGDQLRQLPGVGEAIATKTTDYLAKGTFNLLERVRSEDADVRALLASGLPPATVRNLVASVGAVNPTRLRELGQRQGALDDLDSRHQKEVARWIERGGYDPDSR